MAWKLQLHMREEEERVFAMMAFLLDGIVFETPRPGFETTVDSCEQLKGWLGPRRGPENG